MWLEYVESAKFHLLLVYNSTALIFIKAKYEYKSTQSFYLLRFVSAMCCAAPDKEKQKKVMLKNHTK